MKPFVIRQYDLLEPLTVTVSYANNQAVDLSVGVDSIVFRMMTDREVFVLERAATLVAPNRLRWSPIAGDTDVFGKFSGVFIVTFTDGARSLTFPTRGAIPIIIEEQLPDV